MDLIGMVPSCSARVGILHRAGSVGQRGAHRNLNDGNPVKNRSASCMIRVVSIRVR